MCAIEYSTDGREVTEGSRKKRRPAGTAERRGRFTEPWLILPRMRWQVPGVRSGYLGAYAFGRLAPAVDLLRFDSPDRSVPLLALSIWAAAPDWPATACLRVVRDQSGG